MSPTTAVIQDLSIDTWVSLPWEKVRSYLLHTQRLIHQTLGTQMRLPKVTIHLQRYRIRAFNHMNPLEKQIWKLQISIQKILITYNTKKIYQANEYIDSKLYRVGAHLISGPPTKKGTTSRVCHYTAKIIFKKRREYFKKLF